MCTYTSQKKSLNHEEVWDLFIIEHNREKQVHVKWVSFVAGDDRPWNQAKLKD